MKCPTFIRPDLLLTAILIGGCATRPTGTPVHSWVKPDDTAVAGVANFGKVSLQIWRGAQPSTEGFRSLERAGVKTVLSLRSDHDDFELLRRTKLKYLRIPMHAWDPEQGDLAQLILVLATLDKLSHDRDSWPVFVHCAEGKDRTGYCVAAYRMVFDSWPSVDAIEEMFDYRFNTIWVRNPGF